MSPQPHWRGSLAQMVMAWPMKGNFGRAGSQPSHWMAMASLIIMDTGYNYFLKKLVDITMASSFVNVAPILHPPHPTSKLYEMF